jgi:trehalose-phosphatase
VALPDGARNSLETLACGRSTHVAIISGRTHSDLAPRIADLGRVWTSSDHGAVVVDPEGRKHVLGEHVARAGHSALRARAENLARAFAGTSIEVKPRSIALHYRGAADEAHPMIKNIFAAACVTEGARILYGRKVIEGQFGGADKGAALRFIAANLPSGTAVVYAGDDTTDEPALRYAHERALGLAFYVQSAERKAPRVAVDGYLEGPSEWHELLAALARLRRADGAQPLPSVDVKFRH